MSHSKHAAIKQTFKVWFKQVNQTVYTVEAPNEEAAMCKAAHQWKREHSEPAIGDCQKQEAA